MTDYSKMSDFEINKRVAIDLGHQCYYGNGSYTNGLMGRAVVVKGNGVVGSRDYCNSWSDAGPIIQKAGIAIMPDSTDGGWIAFTDFTLYEGEWLFSSDPANHANDSSPLRAAMVVFLMMNEGA